MGYRFDYSIVINADKEKVKKCLVDYNTWQYWSQWFRSATSNCRIEVEDNGGVGNVLTWEGVLIGEGRDEIVDITENTIEIMVKATRPAKSKLRQIFALESLGDKKTKVTWQIYGGVSFFDLFLKRKKMPFIEDNYDIALEMLKEYIEEGEVDSKISSSGLVKIPKFRYLYKKIEFGQDEAEQAIEKAVKELKEFAGDMLCDRYSAFSLYEGYDVDDMKFKFKICVPVKKKLRKTNGFRMGKSKKTWALKITHKGDKKYKSTGWLAGYNFLDRKKAKMKRSAKIMEVYNDTGIDSVVDMYLPVRSRYKRRIEKFI